MGMTAGAMRPCGSRQGFTLIEMVASLAIVGILAAIAGVGLVQLTEGFLLSRNAAETAQKAQMAMLRMVNEFNYIIDVSGGDRYSIVFDSYHADEFPDTTRSFSLAWNGTPGAPLLMSCRDCPNGAVTEPLVDQVVSFALSYVYYDAAGSLVTATSHGPEWAAAFASPLRQAGLRVHLQLRDADSRPFATTVFLGKHD